FALSHALALLQPPPQTLEHGLRRIYPGGLARNSNAIAAAGHAYTHSLFDPDQMAVVIAKQQREQCIVAELEGYGLARM
ncbi:MAG: hypothetical protein JO110_26290, partial [Acetobacteraceae bacterium]|nr:hypothetical protein [Acetobacteraceae bacterium]